MADAATTTTTDTATTVDPKRAATVSDTTQTATTTDVTKTTALAAGATDTDAIKPEWSDDWRQNIAKSVAGKAEGDEYTKELKRLERFTSPAEVYKSNRELEGKLTSGKMKAVLPENATAEQVAEYRKDNGIPELASGYDIADVGFEINDVTKPRVEAFTKAMHDLNAPPAVVKSALKVYGDLVAQEQQAIATKDADALKSSRSELRAEWSGEYDANFNAIEGMLDTYPALKAALAEGRTKDGTPFGYSAPAMKELAMMARELNPMHTIVTQGGGDKMASIEGEMKTLEGKMGTTSYTEADRARYVELTEVTQKMKAKAA